jgi:hypothetical protein
MVDPDGHCAQIDNYSGCEGLAADEWIKSVPARKTATAKHWAQVQMAAILLSGTGGSTPTAATPQVAAAPRDCGFMGAGCVDLGQTARDVGKGLDEAGKFAIGKAWDLAGGIGNWGRSMIADIDQAMPTMLVAAVAATCNSDPGRDCRSWLRASDRNRGLYARKRY